MTAIIDALTGCGCLFLLVIAVLALPLGISQGATPEVITTLLVAGSSSTSSGHTRSNRATVTVQVEPSDGS